MGERVQWETFIRGQMNCHAVRQPERDVTLCGRRIDRGSEVWEPPTVNDRRCKTCLRLTATMPGEERGR